MALCSNCGGKIKEGVRFCPSCGKPAVNTGYPPGYKPKDWTTTLLLCIFLGWLGGHRFYVGKIGTAILNIIVTVVTVGIGSFIWFIIDLIRICTFKFKDKHGYPLKHKSMPEVPTSPNMPVYTEKLPTQQFQESANIGNDGGSVYDKAESVESAAQNLPEQESEIKNSSEKINEFKAFMQNLFEAEGGQLTGDGVYWESIPEKICINATKAHAIPGGESILMVFDESILGSGKAGMVFTDWGIRYKSAGDSWRLSWNDISEKYTLVKTRTADTFMIYPDGLLLQAKSSDNSEANKPINLSVYIDYDILAVIIDKSCQIFTGRKVEVLDNTVVNKYLQKREANGFLDYLQEENKSGALGTNAIINTGPSKQIGNFSGTLNLLDDEEIIALFEGIQKGTGENGLSFTSWGVRYRDNVNMKKLDLSWKELGEKCTFHKEESKSFRINSKQDGLAAYEIDLKPSMPNADILEVLLLNGCMIMNGKEPYAVDPEAYETDVKAVENQPEQEELTWAQKAEMKRWRKEAARDDEFLENIRNGKSSGDGSFLSRNIGGIITAVIMAVLIFSIGKPLAGIVAFPVSLLGYSIGNKLRLWLHPDFVIASGFMGLLKEKIFWRFVPQLIGAFIGAIIAATVVPF